MYVCVCDNEVQVVVYYSIGWMVKEVLAPCLFEVKEAF